MLDFNAIAQGYTVDVLAAYLESIGIINYLVELGGEVKAKGKKNNEEYWTIGNILNIRKTVTLASIVVISNANNIIRGLVANYICIPIKAIKAIPINPVIIKVIPNPLKGAGTLE